MSDGYTKLFGSIVHSTVWREPAHVRLVWITMLALVNRDGVVEASVPGLADAARVSLDECLQALIVLSSPDAFSRSKAHEGRRVTEVEGGWLLVNHGAYRERMSAEDRREKTAVRVQRYRERRASTVTVESETTHSVTERYEALQSVTVTQSNACNDMQKQKQIQIQIQNKPEREVAVATPRAEPELEEVFEFWRLNTRHQKSKLTAGKAKQIRNRLKEGWTVEQLKQVVTNARTHPDYDGSKGTVYDAVDNLFCNHERVEKLLMPVGGKAAASRFQPPVSANVEFESRQALRRSAAVRELMELGK